MKYSIIVVIVFTFFGCSKQKYGYSDLPDKCFKSNLIISGINIKESEWIIYESKIVRVTPDGGVAGYYEFSNLPCKGITILVPINEYQIFCYSKSSETNVSKSIYYMWLRRSRNGNTFSDTATVITNIESEYFKKLFPNHKGKIIIENKDSIFVEGRDLPENFYKIIKAETR